MIEKIKPTTEPTLDKEGNIIPTEFTLQDKDYLLITAINKLASEIRNLRLGR